MQTLIDQFLEHLRYERNVSAHTLRNYSSDLEQFLDFSIPAERVRVIFRTSPRSITSRFASGWHNCTVRKKRKPPLRGNSPLCERFSSFSCVKE